MDTCPRCGKSITWNGTRSAFGSSWACSCSAYYPATLSSGLPMGGYCLNESGQTWLWYNNARDHQVWWVTSDILANAPSMYLRDARDNHRIFLYVSAQKDNG